VDATDGRGSPQQRAPTPELGDGTGWLRAWPSVVWTEGEKVEPGSGGVCEEMEGGLVRATPHGGRRRGGEHDLAGFGADRGARPAGAGGSRAYVM
jgi:hypothetical protein